MERFDFTDDDILDVLATMSDFPTKRFLDEGEDRPAKMQKVDESQLVHHASDVSTRSVEKEDTSRDLLPSPFFYYRDFSRQEDPDPLTPLTPPGRVPSFPHKMHAILARQDLADIVAWLPHGRSFRILKPREFEVKVIPVYFEHAKFSSFIRQANGWGFRRLTSGRDRGSYYHELFLRGLPHLCKEMKRPGVAEKKTMDPDHEPDLRKISEVFPVPQGSNDESILLKCILENGPRARMPIYSGPSYKSSLPGLATATQSKFTPGDQQSLLSFQQALGASENQFKTLGASAAQPSMATQTLQMPQSSFFAAPSQFCLPGQSGNPLAMANSMAFGAFSQANMSPEFVAGYAAAMNMASQQLLLGAMQQQQKQRQESSEK